MPSISACLIVRDEEENLPLCLEALEPWVDQICVLDTGSTDRTVEIARERGATVGSFEWCDDFAAARNACLALAGEEWILSIDADELVDPESGPALRAAIADEKTQAFLVWLDNLDGEGQTGKPSMHSVGLARLFRNRADIRWTRPVHESVMESLIALGSANLEHSGLRLVHSGYLSEVVRSRGKRERNLAILRRRRETDPDDIFNLYKLGTTLGTLERIEEGREVLEDAWNRGRMMDGARRAALPFLPLVAAELSRLSIECGAPGRGAEVAEEGLTDYPSVGELLYHSGEALRRTGNFKDAWKRYVDASTSEAWTDLYAGDPGARGYKPLTGLAKLAALAGDLRLAANMVAQALELEPGDLGLRSLSVRLAAIGGEVLPAWRSLGELIEKAPGHPDVSLLAAEMAWSKNETETAVGFWRSALTVRGGAHTARAWLAIEELSRGEFGKVAEHLEALRPIDLPEAAAMLVLAAIEGRELALEGSFDRQALLSEIPPWLAELQRDPQGRALLRFAEGAPALSATVPGIETLMSPEP
jgi:tetratricopeptide (TPR) repeat protein